jgi:hypothetical protein
MHQVKYLSVMTGIFIASRSSYVSSEKQYPLIAPLAFTMTQAIALEEQLRDDRLETKQETYEKICETCGK